MRRREQREHIFKLLFISEFNTQKEMEEQLALYLADIENLEESDRDYISRKYMNIMNCTDELDEMCIRDRLGAVLGLQAVRGLVAPAMDAIKRTALGRTAGAIPAVGNAVNAVTELILAGALLVKNCLGAMAVVVLLLAGDVYKRQNYRCTKNVLQAAMNVVGCNQIRFKKRLSTPNEQGKPCLLYTSRCV